MVALAALLPKVAAQACTTVDTYLDGSEYGLPADCAGLLAMGYSCEDLACYAPSVPANSQCGVQNPAEYAGQCSLTCGQNTYDGVYGEGACDSLIAAGTTSCATDYGTGQTYEGSCDFSCAFCSIDPAPDPLPPPTPPAARGNSGTSPWQCNTRDVLDDMYAAGVCAAHLGTGELSCDEHFAGGGQHAGQCAKACQLNILEHPAAFMAEELVPAFANIVQPWWPYVSASTKEEFVAHMQPGLCRILIEADLAAGYGDACSQSFNNLLPADFGGQGVCDFACNRCTTFGDDWSADEVAQCGSPITVNAADIQLQEPWCETMLQTGAASCYPDFLSSSPSGGYCDYTCFGAALATPNFGGPQVAEYSHLATKDDCTAGGGAWVVHTPANAQCKTAAGAPTGACCADPTAEDVPQCANWISAFGGVDVACPNLFAPDRMRAGQCDIACGYCAATPNDCSGEWGDWGACSASCGSGTQTREYSISVQSDGGEACPVAAGTTEEQACESPNACVDCVGEWGDWGACSASCGSGTQTRTYAVTTPAVGGTECNTADGSTENQQCTSTDANGAVIECSSPVDCVGSWGLWGGCSAACGSGTQTRTYTVTQQSAAGGAACSVTDGDSAERACDAGVACVDCEGAWGDWEACSVSCGTGVQTRRYSVSTPAAGGAECDTVDGATEDQQCSPMDSNGNAIECLGDVDCVGAWGFWGSCNAACGPARQSRRYIVTQHPANNGQPCDNVHDQTEDRDCEPALPACASCSVGEEPSPDGTSCVPCADGFYSGYGDSCSACIPPRVVSGNRGSCIDAPAPAPAPQERVMTGDVSIDATMEEVEADRAGFEADFQAAMVTQFASSGVSISTGDVTIESIVPGSVVVSYSIRVTCVPSECDDATAANVAAVAAADSGILAVGSFLSVTPAPAPATLPSPVSQTVSSPSPTTATSAGSTTTATLWLVVAVVAVVARW